jgi:dienelactone hydrolase
MINGGRTVGLATLFIAFLCFAPAAGNASEEVKFHSAPVPPTAFKMRLAKERGEAVAPELTEEIGGTLYRPSGQGPFPAVVVLHGCGGRLSSESENAAWFTSLGYAALYVDSFAPRGIRHTCSGTEKTIVDRVMDALGALTYLTSEDFVQSDRIALVGMSDGGDVALRALAIDGPGSKATHRFKGAVAYYPPCDEADVYAPTLVLIGELDDWASASKCREMMRKRTGQRASVRLIVYPDAHHNFDVRGLAGKPRTVFGHRLEYNEAADVAARDEMKQFLKQIIGQ